MKRKGFIKGALSLSLAAVALFGFGACGSGENSGSEGGNDGYLLEMKTVYALAQKAGFTGTLDELVALFKGAAGEKGADGVGIESAEIDKEGNLLLTLTNGKVLDCGSVTGSGGGTSAPSQQLAGELYAALAALEPAGVKFHADAVTNFSVAVADGVADFTQSGLFADAFVYHTDSGGGQGYTAEYVRGDKIYEANWESGSSAYASIAELSAAIRSGEYALASQNVETGGAAAILTSPFLMKAVKNLPAALGGKARATASGYTLTYTPGQAAAELLETLRLLAAAIDADKTMTVADAVEYEPVKELLQGLLQGVTAQETADFLQTTMQMSMGTPLPDETFYEVFPRPAAGADAWAYVGACLSSPTLGRSIFDVPVPLGLLNAYDTLCLAVYGVDTTQLPDALLPSLEKVAESVLESLRAPAGNSWMRALFTDDIRIGFTFDENKKPLSVELEMKMTEGGSFDRSVTVASAEAEFLDEAPALVDLKGCKYVTGYTYEDVKETRSLPFRFTALGDLTYYVDGAKGGVLSERYIEKTDGKATGMFCLESGYGYGFYENAEGKYELQTDYDTGELYYKTNDGMNFVDLGYVYSLDKYYLNEDASELYVSENEVFYRVFVDKNMTLTKGERADNIETRVEQNVQKMITAVLDVDLTVQDNTAAITVKCGEEILAQTTKALTGAPSGGVEVPGEEMFKIDQITIDGVTYEQMSLMIIVSGFEVRIEGDYGEKRIAFLVTGVPAVGTIA